MDINTKDVEFSIGQKNILNGISLNATGSEFVGIIGPNGSGKSTFLKCVYRVLKATKGAIYMDGAELSEISVKESAKKLGVVSQHNQYNFDFTVQEMVLMGRNPHKKTLERDTKEDFEIVDAALKKVDMLDFADRQYSTLSGGEQQRIILARALAQQTQALILDEPTNHLDIKYQLQLLKIVKNLNILVVAAFHDLNIAGMYCDRIYALKDGHLVKTGTAKEVITPEIIKELYDVEASVGYDAYDRLTVTYKPI